MNFSHFSFSEEDYTRKPKDKLWLNAEEQDFGLPKVLIDNSTAVEGFEKAAAVFNQKKQELLDNINVVCGINKSRGAIVCYFEYEFIQ
jgi:hypothetical protein